MDKISVHKQLPGEKRRGKFHRRNAKVAGSPLVRFAPEGPGGVHIPGRRGGPLLHSPKCPCWTAVTQSPAVRHEQVTPMEAKAPGHRDKVLPLLLDSTA